MCTPKFNKNLKDTICILKVFVREKSTIKLILKQKGFKQLTNLKNIV